MPWSKVAYGDSYGWREAARFAGIDYDTGFCALDGEAQSAIVAHWKAHMQLEAVLAQDREQRQRRAQRNARRQPPKR